MRQEAGGQALHSLPKPVFVWDLQFKYLLQTYYVPDPLLRTLTHGLFEFPSYKGKICKKPVGFTGLLWVIALTRPREELKCLRARHQCRHPDSGLSCSYIVTPFSSTVALVGWKNSYSWHQETVMAHSCTRLCRCWSSANAVGRVGIYPVRFVLAPDSLQKRTAVCRSSGYLGADAELQVEIGDLGLISELTLSSFVTLLLNPLWWQFRGVLGREGYEPAWWDQGTEPSISMNELMRVPFWQTRRLHRSTVSQRLDKSQSTSYGSVSGSQRLGPAGQKRSQQVRALRYLLVC